MFFIESVGCLGINMIFIKSKRYGYGIYIILMKSTDVYGIYRMFMEYVWNCSSFLELSNIHKEYSTLPRKEFMETFLRITSVPYHYLAICTVAVKIKMHDSFQSEVHLNF